MLHNIWENRENKDKTTSGMNCTFEMTYFGEQFYLIMTVLITIILSVFKTIAKMFLRKHVFQE